MSNSLIFKGSIRMKNLIIEKIKSTKGKAFRC